jgi:quercetin dioxygenase-like cupin family protein
MTATVFHARDLPWQPRREGDPRLFSTLNDVLTQSRANLFRYPPGAVGRRHADPIQEEVFVVLAGTLTVHLGEDGAVARHALEAGSVLVVQPGTVLQLSNTHAEELRLFVYGAPPVEHAETRFLDPVQEP